jgi:hypothetical protein
MNLNVKAMFYLTTACLPMLQAAGKEGGNADPAHVLNITSGAGVSPVISGLGAPGSVTPSYATSKAAANHLTRVLAGQLVSKNILVNAIGEFESHQGQGNSFLTIIRLAPGLFPSRMSDFGLKNFGDTLAKV